MNDALVFRVPMPLNLANAPGMNGFKKYRLKCQYVKRLDELLMVRMLPKPPARPLTRAHLAVTLRTANGMDRDNAEARCKWALDWLKTRGYIVDDKPAVLSRDPVVQERCPRKDAALVMTLTPAEG